MRYARAVPPLSTALRFDALFPIRELGATALLCARSLRAALALIASGARPRHSAAASVGAREQLAQVARQLVDQLFGSLPLVVASLAFVGAVGVIDGGRQIEPLFGDPAFLGPALLQLTIREFGPTFTGMIAATRLAAQSGAELSAMAVSEQLDALRLSAVDPAAELVAPRLLAALPALLLLAVVGTVASALAGAAAGSVVFGSRFGAYLDPQLLGPSDFVVGAVKALAYGVAIPAVSARAGISARGGALGVGRATTAAVVRSLVAVVTLDLLLGGTALAVGL
jgi:phospholipid/cholesterol/gamma-HCH transport system permease protein